MSLILLPLLFFTQDPAPRPADQEVPWGHSHIGGAFDEGPRQHPWRMSGVGQVHFPITSSHPDAQAWFEQGVALLHGFWEFEAERSFRYVAQLDPDCAMAFWGLAQAARRAPERQAEFLQKARERRDQASEREQAFLDLAFARQDLEDADPEEHESLEERAQVLADRLVMDHPDDLEALAFAGLVAMREGEGGNRLGVEAILQRILERNPDHVGALHYRIHNWDGKEGEYAIDSCQALSAAAPDSGHLQHMPGHVLSGIGMWHEAAIAQDNATRVEQVYMNRRRVMPEDNWNYMHNLDYLAYVQGQLGLREAALQTVLQLVVIPLNVDALPDNPMFRMMGNPSRMAVVRELIRGERWEELLDKDLLPPPNPSAPGERIADFYGEAHAHLGLEDITGAEASLGQLEDVVDSILERIEQLPAGQGPPSERMEMIRSMMELPAVELRALITLAHGEHLRGIQLLTEYAERQAKSWRNDPPAVPYYGYNLLGDALLELGSPALAAEAYEATLETIFHDGVALAGLVQAYHRSGREEEAAQALADLEITWAEADADNARLAAARATGLQAARGALPAPYAQPMQQRRYAREVLAAQGPCLYQPTQAPQLSAVDADGEKVSLTDLRGRSVLLMFYLGEQCTHCVEQLAAAEERYEALHDLGVEVLAVSKDSVEKNAGAQADFRLRLLSDPEFTTAKRYGSYDDFEDVELHSTVLIDPQGRIHYIKTGGEPFMNFEFLEQEARRLQEDGAIPNIRGKVVGTAQGTSREAAASTR